MAFSAVPETAGGFAERASWVACITATAMLAGMLWWTRSSIALSSALIAMSVVAALLLVYWIYARIRPDPRLAGLAGSAAVFFWSGTASNLMALAALRTGAPLIDHALAWSDAQLGLDTRAIVVLLSGNDAFGQVLSWLYHGTPAFVLATFMLLSALGRLKTLWEASFAFAASAAFCGFCLAFLPAVAAFEHYGVPDDVMASLPSHAGVFHLDTIHMFRSGAINTIELVHLQGVATFPSFHATMAAIIAFGLKLGIVTFFFGAVLAALILLATIVIGGHYAVDLPAGIALFAACILWLRRAGRRR